MEQKIAITRDEAKINSLLLQGWKLKSIVAQHVTGPSNNVGLFCFLLERD